jgi:cellulose synthase/poly-beta-1,6-N-acetylglucosamine synthase-like glycosyltransferase
MAEIVFWSLTFLIFYTYAGYSVLIMFLSVFVRSKVDRKEIEPRVSMLIAAYNEEAGIREKLENTLKLDYPKNKLEIMVVSDGSTDLTDSITREFGARGVKLFRVEGRVGKTEARNRAVREANGEIIVFSDATTRYEPAAVRMMIRNFNDPSVGAVSGRYEYTSSKGSSVSFANILFWRYENFIKSRQSGIKTLTGMSGCINSFRKELYEPLPPDIIEDLVEPLKILEKGYRVIFEPEALAHELTTETARQEFKMRIRVISQGMSGLLYAKALFNPFKYPFASFQLLSHKVLRWFVPFFLIGILLATCLAAADNLFYKAALVLQAVFYASAFLGLLAQNSSRRSKLLSFPLYFCTLNLASMIAFFRVMTGKNIRKWETVR